MAREPITWRNITTVSGDSAGSTLRGSADAVTAGFDSLSKILGQFQEGRQKAFDYGQDDQAATFQDRLAQARSTEEFAALRDSEEMRSLYSQLTPDRRNELRGAENDWEQKLISQLGLREQRADAEFDRSNRDAYAQELLGAVGGDQGSVARLTGLRSDGAAAVREGWDMFTSGQGEQRAQDQNTRAWNDDRRAANRDARDSEAHGWRRTEQGWRAEDRQELVAERDRRRDQDEVLTMLYQSRIDQAANNPSGVGLSQEQQNADVRRHALESGLAKNIEEADALVERLNTALVNNVTPSQLTQMEAQSQLDRINASLSRNPYDVERTSADQEAAEVLSGFTEGSWRVMDTRPSMRRKITNMTARVLNDGVQVSIGGKRHDIQVTPTIVKNALQYMEPRDLVLGTNSVHKAVQKYVEDNPYLLNQYRDFQDAQRERARINLYVQDAQATGPGRAR